MSTLVADQIALPDFNPASRQLQATDLFYVYQQQYGEVALPAQLVIEYLRQSLGVSLFVTNGVPADNQGLNNDYAIDLTTGVWYGPKTDGSWPGTQGYMTAGSLSAALQASITTQIQDAVIGGNGGPLLSSGVPSDLDGFPGQLCFDLTNGLVYGPYTNGAWGEPVPLLASALTSTLQDLILSAAKSQIETELGATSGATKIGYGASTVDTTLTGLTTQVENLISGGAGSTLILVTASGTITDADANSTVVFEGENEVDPVLTFAAGTSFTQNTFVNITNRAGNPDAVVTLALASGTDFFSAAAYSPTTTGITTVALAQGDTVRIGFTGTGNFVVLDGTALLQFSSTNVQAPDLADSSNRISTTAFGKTLRHGLIEIPVTSTPITITDEQAAYAILVFTGALSANTVVYLPNRPGTYTLRDETTGAHSLTAAINVSNTQGVLLGEGLANFVMVRQGVGVFDVAGSDAATSPTVTVFSTTIGNVVAGATTLATTNQVSSLTYVFANGAFLTPNVDYTANGKNIVLTAPVVTGVPYVVMSATLLNNSSMMYTPAVVSLTLAAGATTLTYPYPVGFVDVYVGGAFETNYTATDGQTIVFPASQSIAQSVTLRIYTPVIINGMLPLSGGVITGNLTVNGAVNLLQRPTFNGYTPLDSGNFSSLALFTQPLLSAIARTLQARLQDVVSVKDFGAKGDGSTDDSVAIQLALNSGAKAVFVPAGTYIASGLVMPSTAGFVLYGVGTASILKQKGGGATVLSWVQTSIYYQQGYIRDLAFDGTNGANNTIDTTGVGGETFQNLYFNNTPTGFSSIYVNGAASTYTHDIRLKNIQIYSALAGFAGIRFGPLSSDQQLDGFMMNGNFAVQYCLYLDVGASTLQVSNSHPYNAATNVLCAAGTNASCSFNGVVLDNATSDIAVLTNASNWRFTDCYFEAIKAGKNGLTLTNTAGITFYNCEWDAASGAGSAIVEAGTATGTKVMGGSIGIAANYTTIFTFLSAQSYALGLAGYNPLGMAYPLVGCTSTAQAQNSTLYLGANGGQASSSATAYVVPQNGFLQSVYIATTSTPASGQTFTFAVYDGTTQIGTGTIASGSYSVTITLNKTVTQFDQIYIQSVFSATSGSSFVRWSMMLTA